jgi:hypothetical protein
VSILTLKGEKLTIKVERQVKGLATEEINVMRREGSAKALLEAGLNGYLISVKVAVARAMREALTVRLRVETEREQVHADSNESSGSLGVV